MSKAASKVLKYGFVVLGAALILAGCASINVSIANGMLKDANQYREEAKRLYQEGSYQESVAEVTKSLDSFKQALKLCASEPDCEQQFDEHSFYSETYALRALARIGLEQYPAALEDARAAIAEKDASPYGHQALIMALLASGEREAARAELPKAKPMTPDQEKYLDYLFKLATAAEAAQAVKTEFDQRTPFAGALTAYNAQNYTLALELWLPLAQKGDAKAFEWFLRSAKQGDQLSMAQVGESYLLGRGVKKNGQEAAKWLQAAAEKGVASDAYSLGMMYYEGQDVAKDEQAALRWIRQAAEAGYSDGQVMLGYIYENGLGVGPDPAKGGDSTERRRNRKIRSGSTIWA